MSPTPSALSSALRRYEQMSSANTVSRTAHTAKAWDRVAADIESAIESDGVTGQAAIAAADRARDARLNAMSLRARGAS